MAKTYEEIKNGAYMFSIATKALEAMGNAGLTDVQNGKSGGVLAHMMIPSFVLKAFSCELALKSLVVKEQGNVKDIHKLNVLYHMLGEPTKNSIANAIIGKMKVHNASYGMTEFLKDLDGVANVFVDWRYFYEDSRSLNILFFGELFDELMKYVVTEPNHQI